MEPSSSGRSAGRSGRADVTRSVVLDAAAKVFGERGYASTRLSDVAEAAGLKSGSLYYHFETREELVTEVLRLSQAQMTTALTACLDLLPADATNIERLRAMLKTQVYQVMTNRDYAMAGIRLRGQLPDDIRQNLSGPYRRYFQLWRDVVSGAQTAGDLRWDLDPTLVRLLLTGASSWLPNWFSETGARSSETIADEFVELFFNGLGKQKPARYRVPYAPLPDLELDESLVPGARSKKLMTRARILDAAAVVFCTRGYDEARLEDIASEAGIKTGSLYYHFESREDLVAELMTLATERTQHYVRQYVDRLPADVSQLDRLCTAMSAHLHAVLGTGPTGRAPNPYTASLVRIVGQVPPEVEKVTRDRRRAYAMYWRTLFAEAATAGEIRNDLDVSVAREAILGSMNWAVEWYRPNGRLPQSDIARLFVSASIDGIAEIGQSRKLSPSRSS